MDTSVLVAERHFSEQRMGSLGSIFECPVPCLYEERIHLYQVISIAYCKSSFRERYQRRWGTSETLFRTISPEVIETIKLNEVGMGLELGTGSPLASWWLELRSEAECHVQ